MGKNKKDSKASKAAPKCACDHPFECACGIRPERPSRGHKWDPASQTWGGKGHKQKGGSGQTSLVSKEATTTAVGKTQVAQWQQLPSELLHEICQRQKRPRPKYKSMDTAAGNLYKYRVIVCDPKDPKKDLFFVPAHAVANEEQAKEEGALLALLQLTPSLPHQRKMPEPYRTTWVNAVEAAKNAAKVKSKKPTNDNNNSITNKPALSNKPSSSSEDNNNNKARASTTLTMAKSYTSFAEKKQQQDEKRKIKNDRFRRHENIRMANQNLPVFMSAHIRRQIEALLRGDTSIDLMEDDDDDEDEEPDNALQLYVQQRMHSEGFTRKQARTAFAQVLQTSTSAQNIMEHDTEDDWEKVYEEGLQWLLVHLDEDQLPEGFDPRGRTLDVVSSGKNNNDDDKATASSDELVSLASRYGLSLQEARLVLAGAAPPLSFEDSLWTLLHTAAGVSLQTANNNNPASSEDANQDILLEEIEALEAIFPEECKVTSNGDGTKRIEIRFTDRELTLQVVVREGVYPSLPPEKVWVTGKWPSSQPIGAALHIELIKFVANELARDEPVVFELHGHIQSLLDSEDFCSQALLLDDKKQKASSTKPSKTKTGPVEPKNEKKRAAPQSRRPRARRPFWSRPPSETPPSIAFPKTRSSIALVRKSLPAAAAREEFLRVLKKADKGGRVLLVTGDTGKSCNLWSPRAPVHVSRALILFNLTQAAERRLKFHRQVVGACHFPAEISNVICLT
jgi:ATP-dependent RNA helicase DHX57